jgi:protein NUD1
VTNLSGLLHLDSLSLRDQSPIEPSTSLDIPPNEARKVYLSSNLLPTTPLLSSTPTLPFLNIQYLELSSAGLQSLPDSFGQRAPNIRTLNLNFNALHDITPLLGIVRLNKLLLAGNRLSRLRKTCLVLSRFKALTKVDLRNNPVTVGFYPALPPAENRVVLRRRRHGKRASRDDSENQQEELLDPYAFPAADVELDRKYVRSLDTGTRMRRRVLELLLAGGNELLREVDGLAFEGAEMLGRRDEVWEGMVRAGVIKNREIEGGEGDKLIREGGVEQGEEGERGTS